MLPSSRKKIRLGYIISLLVLLISYSLLFYEQVRTDRPGVSGNTPVLIIVSLVISVLAIFYSLFVYNQENRKARRYRIELEESIRKLRITNEELKELRSQEKFSATGRVARTIAHEVRNPLTNISLAAEQLQAMTPGKNESSVLFDMISRNAIRINQLVSDLLNATKSIELDIQKININQLLDDTLEMANDRIGLNHITVEKNYTEGTCDVVVDIEKTRFAFLNIFVNAIEAMEKNHGILQIQTKKDKQKCVVEIRDNGKGIAEETLHKIFEPFFTGKPNGNGLGLTNTQNIILSHKGTIKVQSQAGKGTVFSISLDLA